MTETNTQNDRARRRTEWFLLGLLGLFLVLFPLAFWNGAIETDEAWLGQQVRAFVTTGQVTSDLFRDVPPLDGRIVVYHKLLIWTGAGMAKLFGWGILPLRLISALAGLAIIMLIFLLPTSRENRQHRLLAAAILLFTPLFWSYLRMFRPEMLLVAFGWASFLVLKRADESRRPYLAVLLAGALAGLAGLTHAGGLAYVIAGGMALLTQRQWRPAVLFLFAAILFFSPYLSALFTDTDLFGRQLFANAFTDARLRLEWWQPITNLVHEHTRLFRKPEAIGLSTAVVLAILLITREQWQSKRFQWVYLATLLAVGGMAPLPKITRYMLPLTPFFALLVAQGWYGSAEVTGYRRTARKILAAWLVLFFLYGLFALGSAALGPRLNRVETNLLLSNQMQPGTTVIAPFDFVYDGATQFIVQSWWGCEKAARELPTVQLVERYALGTDVRYLILDSLRMHKLRLTPQQIDTAFHWYTPILLLENQQRYLLERVE